MSDDQQEIRYNEIIEQYGEKIVQIVHGCETDYDKMVPPNIGPRANLASLTAHMLAAYFAVQKHEYEKPGFSLALFTGIYRILRAPGSLEQHASAII